MNENIKLLINAFIVFMFWTLTYFFIVSFFVGQLIEGDLYIYALIFGSVIGTVYFIAKKWWGL